MSATISKCKGRRVEMLTAREVLSMKKPQCVMLLWYIVGLLMMGVSAFAVSVIFDMIPQLMELHWVVRLIPALVFMIGAVVAHLLSGKKVKWAYVLSYVLNAVGSGWIVGALMGVKGISTTWQVILAMLPALFLGILYCVLVSNVDSSRKALTTGIFVGLSVLLLLAGVAMWIWVSALIGCVFLFSALFLLPLPIGINYALDMPGDTYRFLSLTGFGAFFLILFAAIVILSEGDGLDGIDFGGEGRAKQKQPK